MDTPHGDDDWEMIEAPPGEQSGPSQGAVTNRISQKCLLPQEIPIDILHPDLHPCKSCASYHYIPQCIYKLSQPEWSEYRARYLTSDPISPHADGEERMANSAISMRKWDRDVMRKERDEASRMRLPEHERKQGKLLGVMWGLDKDEEEEEQDEERGESRRSIWEGQSVLQEDRMTDSARKMRKWETNWQRRQEGLPELKELKGKKLPDDGKPKVRWASSLGDESEDELAGP